MRDMFRVVQVSHEHDFEMFFFLVLFLSQKLCCNLYFSQDGSLLPSPNILARLRALHSLLPPGRGHCPINNNQRSDTMTFGLACGYVLTDICNHICTQPPTLIRTESNLCVIILEVQSIHVKSILKKNVDQR